MEPDFTLELLHFTDQEANAATINNIDNLSAVLNALRDEDLGGDGVADNTLTLSSGDVIIPGLFFDASEAVFGSPGIADILIQNELGLQASALGNHEFDLGTELLAGLISGDADGVDQDGVDFTGADFPYLSANLGFDTDPNLAGLEVDGGLAPQANTVTSSTAIDVNGELIGVVGATVPTIGAISSPGDDLGVFPEDFNSSPTDDQLDALAAILQAEVDALLGANPTMNKVVLLSHMQQISIEEGLAERLTNVDIIVAGGSNTRLFDEDDRARDGDSEQGTYPTFITNAGGTNTALVNTDGNYKYVGRLVVGFDENGNILPETYDSAVSGAYATDDQGVADLGAEGLVDAEVDAITDAIQAQIVQTEGNVFGVSNVFLTGNRSGTFTADDPDGVRTQETNLGNLTADANLAYANQMVADNALGDAVLISIKNGGGIRANIGEIVVPAGGSEAVRVPNSSVVDANGDIVKPEGGISQNDIATTLAFNNGLVLLDITRAELVEFLEGSISALPTGVSGGFPQISGVQFSFDESLPAGERVISAAVVDPETGAVIAPLVAHGEIVGDPSASFRIVTLDFLANSGDPVLSTLSNPNRVDLIDLDADGVDDGAFTGAGTFAEDGTEQDALAEYLNDNFNPDNQDNPNAAFNEADTGPALDERIQNLTFREDTVLDFATLSDRSEGFRGDRDESDFVKAGGGDDNVRGRGEDDVLFGQEGKDRLRGDEGDDILVGGLDNDRLIGGEGDDFMTGGELGSTNDGEGATSDRNVFIVGLGNDTITDFDLKDGREDSFDRLIVRDQGDLNVKIRNKEDLLDYVAKIETDGDRTTDAAVDGNDLVFVFSRDGNGTKDPIVDSVRLVNVIDGETLSLGELEDQIGRSLDVIDDGEFLV